MLIGRFLMIVPLLAMAGSLARKKVVPVSAGTLATDTATFAFLLAAVVLIVGALEYFPALALGPIVEHLQMIGWEAVLAPLGGERGERSDERHSCYQTHAVHATSEPPRPAGYKRPKNAPRSLFDPADRQARDRGRVPEARPAARRQEPGHVRGRSRQRRDHVPVPARTWSPAAHDLLFNGQITLWLWFTVLFANFAEAMAEGRGKAQADALRKTKTETMARKLVDGRPRRSACPAPSCARATSWSARRATSSPATAR